MFTSQEAGRHVAETAADRQDSRRSITWTERRTRRKTGNPLADETVQAI